MIYFLLSSFVPVVHELESKATAGSLFLNKAANTANEQFRRIHEGNSSEGNEGRVEKVKWRK
jgi:hypothetical protein